MTDDPLGIREGEAAIELPDKFDAGIYYIGWIRTPWTQPEECPKNHYAAGHPQSRACPCLWTASATRNARRWPRRAR
jgi:hypothetical protein